MPNGLFIVPSAESNALKRPGQLHKVASESGPSANSGQIRRRSKTTRRPTALSRSSNAVAADTNRSVEDLRAAIDEVNTATRQLEERIQGFIRDAA